MRISEIAELAHNQAFPTSDRPLITKAEFVRTAISEFAYQSLLLYWKSKREEGYYSLPEWLVSEKDLDVNEGVVDVSELNFMTTIPGGGWLIDIKDISSKGCGGCVFIKSSYANSRLLCNDDSKDEGDTPFYFLNGKIKFPKGVKSKSVTVIYANTGDGVTDDIEIDNAMAAIVRDRLMQIYLGKTPKKDETINDNPNT